ARDQRLRRWSFMITSTVSVFLFVLTVLLLSSKISDGPCPVIQGASSVGLLKLAKESIESIFNRVSTAREKPWEGLTFALDRLTELVTLHVKAVAEVVTPLLNEANLPETARRYDVNRAAKVAAMEAPGEADIAPVVEKFLGSFNFVREDASEPAPMPPKNATELTSLLQDWFKSWRRSVQRASYGGVATPGGLGSAISQLKMLRHA
ncbi:hypothetical protein, partial [Variovorax sp. J22R115]|uniref:hypothetical protein n=1 Tax=Variovorax sp. J22R115 TaxID=3053509 RepID=UPI0025777E88